jgi:hypothetical protein
MKHVETVFQEKMLFDEFEHYKPAYEGFTGLKHQINATFGHNGSNFKLHESRF